MDFYEHRVKQAFLSHSLKHPICGITAELIDTLAEKTGIVPSLVQEVLLKNYPHGSIGAFMASYFEMAYKGREECREFEQATADIFRDVFRLESEWLGSAWSGQQVPDILLRSRDGWQAVLDTKAYSRYELPGIHRDRMIYHYLPDLGHTYGEEGMETAFFSYIAGGFSRAIAGPLQIVAQEAGVPGSAVPVASFIRMIERQQDKPYTDAELRRIFSVNRQVDIRDLLLDAAH